jgi:radical SAM-linked protein
MSLSKASIASTGYEDLSLLSLSTGDYGCISQLMERLMERCEAEHIGVSFPSLRAGSLTPKLMQLVKRVRKTGFTIAPEAGSQRLRDVINKNITEQDVSDTVQNAFRLGWQVIKLYFMIGLPTETDEDLQGIVDLVKRLRNIKAPKGRSTKINVSVATFIPKAHTPFQWASQISLEEAAQKIRLLKERLRKPGIHFKWQNPETSMLEGLLARGDRQLSNLLVSAYNKGCKFDGWSDKFKYKIWKESFYDTGVDIDFYTTRTRSLEEPLPWDHIDSRVTKGFLKKEYKKSLKTETTTDCRISDCTGCGVCDFELIEPKVYEQCNKESKKYFSGGEKKYKFYKQIKVSYAKQDQAKYFGHLELVKIFLRAIRRAKIPVKFSEGFHPKPKISFEDTLPLGLESLKECFYLVVYDNINPQKIMEMLNDHLPTGLNITGCQVAPKKSAGKTLLSATYLITKKNGFFNKKELIRFLKSSEHIFFRSNPKGKNKRIDLKEMVLKIQLLAPQRLMLTLKSEPGKTLRPFEAIKNIFSLSEEEIKQAKIVKTDSALKA